MTPGEHRQEAEALLTKARVVLASLPGEMNINQMHAANEQCALMVKRAEVHILLADSLERAS